MPLRLRSAGGGGVTLKPPVALSTEAAIEVPAYDGAKMLTDKTPGMILQVVQADFMTWVSSTSQTLIATGLQATITPKFVTSKILALLSINGMYNSSTSNTVLFHLYKNAAALASLDGSYSNNVVNYGASASYQYLDSPASIAALTYALYFRSSAGYNMGINNYTVSNPGTTRSSITLLEIAA
jgi:hypothetical protein